MTIKSLRDKIASFASGEVLGKAEDGRKDKLNKNAEQSDKKTRSKKNKKRAKGNRKLKSQKTRSKKKSENDDKVSKAKFFKRKEMPEESPQETIESVEKKDENSASIIQPGKDAIEGYEDVLSILGIKKDIKLDVDFESSDLDYIEFSQTTPLGFDFDEVTDFISRVKYTLNKLESALKERNRDLIIVASEVKKVEQRMIEQNQEKELNKMIGGMTEEERLIEENLNLKIELNELKDEIAKSGTSSRLLREIEALRAENQMLKMNMSDEDFKSVEPIPSELPSLSEDELSKGSGMPSIDDLD